MWAGQQGRQSATLAEQARQPRLLSRCRPSPACETLERHVLTRAQQSLRPEIFARITEKIVFHRLSYEQQLEIAEKFLRKEIAFLHAQGHTLTVGDSVLSFLVRKGFHPKLGARPMRDAVEKLIGDAVAIDLLAGGGGSGRLVADAAMDTLVIANSALRPEAVCRCQLTAS